MPLIAVLFYALHSTVLEYSLVSRVRCREDKERITPDKVGARPRLSCCSPLDGLIRRTDGFGSEASHCIVDLLIVFVN
jgi:hypothetical protein